MDEEEILSPREIAVIERWMEKHGITIEEPAFFPEHPWQFALIETIETIRESRKRRILKDLPKDIQERLWLITDKMLFGNCSPPLHKDGDLSGLTPAQRRAVERHLKEIITKAPFKRNYHQGAKAVDAARPGRSHGRERQA
jgi:hypothetical protein